MGTLFLLPLVCIGIEWWTILKNKIIYYTYYHPPPVLLLISRLVIFWLMIDDDCFFFLWWWLMLFIYYYYFIMWFFHNLLLQCEDSIEHTTSPIYWYIRYKNSKQFPQNNNCLASENIILISKKKNNRYSSYLLLLTKIYSHQISREYITKTHQPFEHVTQQHETEATDTATATHRLADSQPKSPSHQKRH